MDRLARAVYIGEEDVKMKLSDLDGYIDGPGEFLIERYRRA